jgi:hypothetical protein
MKFALIILGTLIATLAIFLFVGFLVTYTMIFAHFSGPDSVVENCFAIGFSLGLISALLFAFFVGRYFWRRYSAPSPE